MGNSNFVALVLEFLEGEILEGDNGSEETGITLNLKDVNLEIDGVEWNNALQHYLNSNGYKVRFTFGDGNWTTIIKSEEITRDDHLMKVTVKWTEKGELYFVNESKAFDKGLREVRKGDHMYSILKSEYERKKSGKSVEDDGLTNTERSTKFFEENPNAFSKK